MAQPKLSVSAALLLVMAGLISARTLDAAPVKSAALVLPERPDAFTLRASQILQRQITRRCAATFTNSGVVDLKIELALQPDIDQESYRLSDRPGGTILIEGGDMRGLIYGIGKFLRTSRYDQGGFTPGTWRGASPAAPVRGIYFATHFNNYYEAAPIEEVREYVEDLALWGLNQLQVTFPRWHYSGFSDPDAQRALDRLRLILRAARQAGMQVTLLIAANDDFKSAPVEFRRVPVPDPLKRRGDFGVNLCPSKPKARALLLSDWRRLLDEFKDPGLDAVEFWPYDEGGCGCENCWPWGARGFPNLCRELSGIAREKFPAIKTIISTWTFDTPPAGEWEGLRRFLDSDRTWVDYVLADAHEDFPRYPLEQGVPGGRPLLNFPEISMWGQSPWGGYGANPFPARLQRLWNQTQRKLSGGFPYSEGIYEDLNKVICSQLYWDGGRPTLETVREYVAFEFSPQVTESVARAITLLEVNHDRKRLDPVALEAFRLLAEAEQKLTPQARASWRWRILYLRGLIDRELVGTKGRLEGATLRKAFEELTAIYHAEGAHSMPIHPPVVP